MAGILYHIGHGFFQAALPACFDIKILGRDKLIEEGPSIVVANHQSFLDPPLIGGYLFDTPVRFLARHTLWTDSRLLQLVMYMSESIPINQSRPDPAHLLEFIRTVRRGERVVIFPEGARTPDGVIHDAMPGIGFILSKLTGVPVQPVRIDGAYECLPIHRKSIERHPITLTVGDPVRIPDELLRAKGREAQRAVGRYVMDAIRALPTRP